MPQLIFEVGVEELPALSIEPALEFCKKYLADKLTQERLTYSPIKTYGTPRRLVILIEDLASKQTNITEEVCGPNIKIIFNDDGSLTKAGAGFLSSKNILLENTYKKLTNKGEIIAAKINILGKQTCEILPDILRNLLFEMPFKKRMRWESSGDSFARPIRRLLVLFDKKIINLKFADVSSCDTSRGHSLMAPDEFKVTSCEQYLEELSKRHVVLDPQERSRMILDQAQVKTLGVGCEFIVDDELLNIVKNLVEYPFVILGSFEKKYLDIPAEILVSEMRTHQKCFSVYEKSGKLSNYFITVAGVKPYDENIFGAGNARVLRARFEDGAFYFLKDKQKTLAEHALGLKNLVFERELGSMSEKCERIKQITHGLQNPLKLDSSEKILIDQAAMLIKADLVSGVVGEFPELQGIMGSIYAQNNNLPKQICDAIRMHYWPRSAQDNLPSTRLSAALSIADKLDTIVGILGIGKEPQGNKDPFALRRSAISIVKIIMGFNINLELPELVKLVIRSYGERFLSQEAKLTQKTCEFILARARVLLQEKLGTVSFADGVLAVSSNNLLDIFTRADALFNMYKQDPDGFHSLTQTFKRAGNLVKKADLINNPNPQLLTGPEEKALANIVNETAQIIKNTGNYEQILQSICKIKPKLDTFFDNVMVMAEDQNIRDARLSLLKEIKQISDKLADFTHLGT